MMTIEPAMLRPCPCGWAIGRVSVERGRSGGQGGGWPGKIRITCIGCTGSTGYCATEAEAIAAWNRRTPDELAAPDRRIAELESAATTWRKDACRLSGGLIAIRNATPTVPASVLRGIAYDIALNCIDPETAEFQIEARTAKAALDE